MLFLTHTIKANIHWSDKHTSYKITGVVYSNLKFTLHYIALNPTASTRELDVSKVVTHFMRCYFTLCNSSKTKAKYKIKEILSYFRHIPRTTVSQDVQA